MQNDRHRALQSETIEQYMIEELDVSKKDLGESLSRYYEEPFIEYDEKHPDHRE